MRPEDKEETGYQNEFNQAGQADLALNHHSLHKAARKPDSEPGDVQ